MTGPITQGLAFARHPRRAWGILWARLTGRRLRARQRLAALVGIDHRLALPPGILASYPVEPEGADDLDPSGSEVRVLSAPGHALVAGARRAFADAFAADPGLHALYGDALVQPTPGGPVLPVLRPVFDADYLASVDWLGPVLALRRTPISEAIAAEAPAAEAAFRIAEHVGPGAIGHLPRIVSVRIGTVAVPEVAFQRHAADPGTGTSLPPLRGEGRALTESPAPNLTGPHAETHHAVVRRHLDRTGRADAGLARGPGGILVVAHPLPDPLPRVSVVIPTRDRVDLLRPCIDSLRARTDWPDLEILVADNDSREPETRAYFRTLARDGVRIVPCPGPFDFAGMNNAAAREARGALLAFVNNDVAAFEPDWLRRMAREALRPDVGAVGARLLDGEGRIQHGGIALGTGGLATHAHRHFPGDATGYGERLRATHAVSAVTAACLVVEAAKFRAVGGFDRETFAVDFNDVDLCLRLAAAGYRTLMVPGAVLHHREGASRTRSPEAQARHEREIAALRTRWGPLLAQDPHYHPGFDPDLSTHARLRDGALPGPTGPGAVRRSGPSRSPT